MNIVKAGLFSAIATTARLFAGLVILKLVAQYAGPGGIAKLGQFMSLMSLLVVIAGGGLSTGIVKYVSEYKDKDSDLKKLLSAAMLYTLVTSVTTGLIVVAFSGPITIFLFGDIEYESLIWILAIAQLLVSLNNYIVAVINGFFDIKRVALVHIYGAGISIILTSILTYYFELYGALLSLVLSQAFLVIVSLFFLYKSSYFRKSFPIPKFDAQKTKLLARFSLMTLMSALLPPFVHIWVRDHLAQLLSWEEVGYWQAVSRVSDAYLLFIITAINIYYLPKLSAINEKVQFKNELSSAYFYVMPTVTLLAFGIYLARDLITVILFTSDFLPASNLYGPQLIGDIIKIASYILSYVMLAKALTKTFLSLELIFSATYIGWVWILTHRFGLVGAMYAFAINYVIYLICTAIIAKRYIKTMLSPN